MLKDDDNLIKQVCKKLDLTYRQLADEIGYSESAIKTCVSANKLSESMNKSLLMLLEIHALRQELKNCNNFKDSLRLFLFGKE